MKKKVLVSGVKTTGKQHIANYFGAIRQNVDIGNMEDVEAYVFLADYHSMTTLTNAKERMSNTLDTACLYLACGLDPNKTSLFRQSDIPECAELAWILSTLTPMPMLMLAHAFKDSEAKNKNINVGVFNYPILMAADILVYGGEIIPVGSDQQQHVEMTREIAGKYNRTYGVEQFAMPQAHIVKEMATVPGTDGRKMSKSYDNHIPLFGTSEEIKKRVMGIVTDSAAPADKKNPDENNIYQIHKLFLNEQQNKELRKKFEGGGYGYKQAKDELLETIINFTAPMREKYDHYRANPQEVEQILKSGAEKARNKARETMQQVKKQTGLSA